MSEARNLSGCVQNLACAVQAGRITSVALGHCAPSLLPRKSVKHPCLLFGRNSNDCVMRSQSLGSHKI